MLTLPGTPVLMYHGIVEGAVDRSVPAFERKYWLDATRFRAQLAHISATGHRARLLSAMWNPPATVDHEAPVVVTFDDGRASDYRAAFPALLEAGICAEFFVNTATLGTPGFLSWAELAEMQRAGMSFQSHAHEHVDLSRLPPPLLARQLGESKRRLEDRLGTPVRFLAAPYGKQNRRVVDAALEEGYQAVCTSWAWPARATAPRVSRVAIFAGTGAAEFSRLVARHPRPYLARALRAVLLFLPKRVASRLQPVSETLPIAEGAA